MDLSAAMQHNNDPSEMQAEVFAFDFGDIKLLKTNLSRFYYCYTAQGGFLYVRHAGSADYDETIHYSALLVDDESWPNGAKLFSDLRWLDSRAFSFETHYQLARDIASHYQKNGRYYSNVVALCSDDLEFGMVRMFQSIWEDNKPGLNTVRDLDVATELLGIDQELLKRIITEVDRIESTLN